MHGLYLVWWVQEQQVPAPIVAAILGATDLLVAALEIPTGWFADRVGHRVSLVLGSAVQTVAMLCCWLGTGAAGVAAACALVAIGDGFRSGADEALLFRSTAALGDRSAFQRIEARAQTAALVALVVLTLAGGLIVHRWGFAVGWILEAALALAGLALALAMTEAPESDAEDDGGDDSGTGVMSSAAPRMAVLILPAAFAAGSASAASFIVQTTSAAFSATLFVAVTTLLEAAGASAAWKLVRKADARVMCGIGAASAVLMALAFAPTMALPAAAALSVLAGLIAPLRAAALQQAAAPESRARAASIAHACDMALSTLLMALAGFFAGRRRRRTQ